VGADLRTTALARHEHATQAALIRAHARSASSRQRAERLARAQAHQQLADSLELRETILAEIDTQRARWYDATAQARADALEATKELRRRLPGTDLRPFCNQAHERAWVTEEDESKQHAVGRVELDMTSGDVRHAARLAEQARRMLDERHAQARRRADLERERQADEPVLNRWPHRDPDYDFSAMQRRLVEPAAARLAAPDLRAAVPGLSRASHWPEPSHDHLGRQHRQAERDEPEAAL
jgi:hypothetical protein